MGVSLAAREESEEDEDGEEEEPCAEGDKDCVEEAGGKDVGVEVGHCALWCVRKSMRGGKHGSYEAFRAIGAESHHASLLRPPNNLESAFYTNATSQAMK